MLTSCNPDDPETEELSVEEVQAEIETTFNAMTDCMQGFESGEFSDSVQDFFNIANGEGDSEWAEYLTDQLEPFEMDLENFELSDHAGTYNWNNSSETWDYSDSPSDKLVFNFPFMEGSSNNNVTITLNSYEYQQVMFDNETEYLPSQLNASISVNNDVIFSVDLDNVIYNVGSDYTVPTNFDLEIITVPMTHTFSFDETSASNFSFDYSMHNNGMCATNFSADFSLNTSDYTNISDVEDFNMASGLISHGDLELQYSVDIDDLGALEEPTVTEINNFVSVDVYIASALVGELEYAEENNQSVVYIVFNDGTRENVENYVGEEFTSQIETIFSNFL